MRLLSGPSACIPSSPCVCHSRQNGNPGPVIRRCLRHRRPLPLQGRGELLDSLQLLQDGFSFGTEYLACSGCRARMHSGEAEAGLRGCGKTASGGAARRPGKGCSPWRFRTASSIAGPGFLWLSPERSSSGWPRPLSCRPLFRWYINESPTG